MSPVCHSFVQNAWKKDLCSNCFKSRDEHVKLDRTNEGTKFLPSAFHGRTSIFKKSPTGILRVQSKKKTKRNVRFPEEVSSVIGYGGDDWSDGEEFEVSEDNDDDDTFPDTEEERELHKITKTNTDFNTVKANLLGESNQKSYTSLMLGKAQTDSDGKKKTLLVSVTPFGQDSKPSNVKSHIRKPAIINLTSKPIEDVSNGYKTNIVVSNCLKEEMSELTAKSNGPEKTLLEEITEKFDQNMLDALTLRKTEKPIIEEDKTFDSITDDKKECTETKRNSLTRHQPITKNQERPKVNLTGRSEFKFCKINIDKSSVDSGNSTQDSTPNTSLASDDENFERLDSDNDDSGNFSEPNKCDETVKIKLYESENKSMNVCPISKLRLTDTKSGGYSTFQAPIIMDMPSIIPKKPDTIFSAEASRELAGEPDGRADPDELGEAPALPKSPIPPMDPRPSFLHGLISDMTPSSKPIVPEKPKLPLKPVCVLKTAGKKSITPTGKCNEINSIKDFLNDEKNNEITEVQEDKPEPIYYAKPVLTKQDSDSSLNSLCKRKAPTPPSNSAEENISNLYQRNPNIYTNLDSPVVKEIEKRDRATFSKIKPNDDLDTASIRSANDPPEPAPRRNLSLSHDNLLIEEKRKGKMKFSIKKLLRIGSTKDLDKKDNLNIGTVTKLSSRNDEIYDIAPKPKPRLVIIHPLDINGTNVEVVKSNEISDSTKRTSHDDTSSIYSGSSSATDIDAPIKVMGKPPPPPRHTSSESKSVTASPPKPARPPPPKSVALQKKQKQQTWTPAVKKDSTIYANLGEIRSSLAPRKPERTASMREREAQLELPKRRNPINDDQDDIDDEPAIVQATNDTVIHSYDDVYNSAKYDSIEDNLCDSAKSSDSDYEYVNHARSSSPECDAAIKTRESTVSPNQDPELRKAVDYPKYSNGVFNRSSLPYCGSETESEIYSPYSFYSSNDNMDSPCGEDYQNDITSKTTNKLRVRKGRSVVHKNLEDNYGAVVIANHEALAQVLEQVQQSVIMQPSLRGLKSSTNLRWNDFSIQPTSLLKAGRRYFYPAVWNSAQGAVNVTLMLHKEQMASQIVCQQSLQPQTLSLNAVTEFCDLVPLQKFGENGDDLVQATVVVMAPSQVDTIQSYGKQLQTSESLYTKDHQLLNTEQAHEAVFMMLQLINGLKYLQARGVEEAIESLTCFVVLRDQSGNNNNSQSEDRLSSLSAPKTNCYGRLCVLQGLTDESSKKVDEDRNSLCKCAINALDILLPNEKLKPLLNNIFQEERAISMNQAKSVLEFTLWGPLDVVQGVPIEERELSLQRWLDLERATVLHGLVRSRVQLNVFEQLHLMFLVRSTAKSMCDASVLLENAKVY